MESNLFGLFLDDQLIFRIEFFFPSGIEEHFGCFWFRFGCVPIKSPSSSCLRFSTFCCFGVSSREKIRLLPYSLLRDVLSSSMCCQLAEKQNSELFASPAQRWGGGSFYLFLLMVL